MRGIFAPILTTRKRREGDNEGDFNGAAFIPTSTNQIKSFPKNAFIQEKEREISNKLSGVKQYLYNLYVYSLEEDLSRLSRVFDLLPVELSSVDNNKINEISKALNIDGKLLDDKKFKVESLIDFSQKELIKCYREMHYGAYFEADRLFAIGIEDYNLPRPLQVTLVDHITRLQNVKFLLSKSEKDVFQDVVLLKKAIQTLFDENKTLENIYNCIHEINKKNFLVYPYKNATTLLKKFLKDFIEDTLKDCDSVFWDVRNPAFLKSFNDRSQ